MKPKQIDIVIRRGVSFELELIAQVKIQTYDPNTHIGPADLKRTHAENQAHYGFTYAYLDFASVYSNAELRIMKPWVKAGQAPTKPLMTLTKGVNEITFTSKSTKVVMDPDTTKSLEFDAGSYELLLLRSGNAIDCLAYGEVTVLGDKG